MFCNVFLFGIEKFLYFFSFVSNILGFVLMFKMFMIGVVNVLFYIYFFSDKG